MAWSDYWTPIKYGVAAVTGLTITVLTYLSLVEDDYITVDKYATVMLGTVERSTAMITRPPVITTNTIYGYVSFSYSNDPSGRQWTPPCGYPTNTYLVPVIETNDIVVVSTNWIYNVSPPAIVTVERITVGKVITGFVTNYLDTNVVWHKSPPEDPATNTVPWTNIISIITNDSPAILTNGMTNAITSYIPGGAISNLQYTIGNLIPQFYNTQTALPYDMWTVTGIFAHCGFTNGWDTNAGPQYIAKTNLAQIYAVLSRLRISRAPLRAHSFVRRVHDNQGAETWDDVRVLAEGAWAGAPTTYTGDAPFYVFAHTDGWMRDTNYFEADADAQKAVPMIYIHNELSADVSFHINLDISGSWGFPGNRAWNAHNSGLTQGWNNIGTFSAVSGLVTGEWVGAAAEQAIPFPLTWGTTPSTVGTMTSLVFQIPSTAPYEASTTNCYARLYWQFLYCTNAP